MNNIVENDFLDIPGKVALIDCKVVAVLHLHVYFCT